MFGHPLTAAKSVNFGISHAILADIGKIHAILRQFFSLQKMLP